MDAPPTDDASLIAAAQAGDALAYETLVRRHAALVAAVCRRVLGREDGVEDAAHAAFLVLHRRLRDLDRQRPLAPWLHGVAHRCALKARSLRRRAPEVPMDAVPEPTAAEPDTATAEQLDAELAALPARERAALVLVYLDGRPHRDAAAALGVPSGSLSRIIAAGLQRLRHRLVRRGVDPHVAGALVLPLAGATPPSLLTHLAGPPSSLSAAIAAQVSTSTVPAFLTGYGAIKAFGAIAGLAAAAIVVLVGLLGDASPPGPPPPDRELLLQPRPPLHLRPFPASDDQQPAVLYQGTIVADGAALDLPVLSIGVLRQPDVLAAPSYADVGRLPQLSAADLAPATLLRQPRATPAGTPAEEIVAVLISPRSEVPGGDWWPAAIACDQGRSIIIDQMHAVMSVSTVTPPPIRHVHIFALGRLGVGQHRIDLRVRHYRQIELSQLCVPLSNEDMFSGSITIAPGDAEAPATVIAQHLPSPTLGEPRRDGSSWQSPSWSNPNDVIFMDERSHDDTNERSHDEWLGMIGLVYDPGRPDPRQLRTTLLRLWPDEPAAALAQRQAIRVGILGPPMRPRERVSLRSIIWRDRTATITCAAWKDHAPRDHTVIQHQLLRVSLHRPPGVAGPVRVRLAWKHLIAPEPGGVYVRQPRTDFGGVTELDGITLP